jgi:hypothetical protein
MDRTGCHKLVHPTITSRSSSSEVTVMKLDGAGASYHLRRKNNLEKKETKK